MAVSIHAFLEEGDRIQFWDLRVAAVSIHAFLEEGESAAQRRQRLDRFQSTPSLRKASGSTPESSCWGGVSIHAFLEEGDAISGMLTVVIPIYRITPIMIVGAN